MEWGRKLYVFILSHLCLNKDLKFNIYSIYHEEWSNLCTFQCLLITKSFERYVLGVYLFQKHALMVEVTKY